MTPFGDGPVILDGGLATELEARGCDISGALWSARVLHERRELRVAASVSPYGAISRDGAEYRGDYGCACKPPDNLRRELIGQASVDEIGYNR